MKSLCFGLIVPLFLTATTAIADNYRPAPGREGRFVRDANNQRVGKISERLIDGWIVRASIAGVAVSFEVSESGFTQSNQSVVYESDDCSGQPYIIFITTAERVVHSTTRTHDAVLYYAPPGTQSIMLDNESSYNEQTGCRSFEPLGTPRKVVPAQTFDLGSRFTPPFRAR